MKLTRSTGYALAGLVCVARDAQDKPIPAKIIAKKQRVPLEYLLKVMQQLVRAGLITGIRGPQGGFSLTRDAKEVTLLEIVEAVEGGLDTNTRLPAGTINRTLSGQLSQTYQKANQELARILSRTTLASFLPPAKKTKRKK